MDREIENLKVKITYILVNWQKLSKNIIYKFWNSFPKKYSKMLLKGMFAPVFNKIRQKLCAS